jgi:hypothetical protein
MDEKNMIAKVVFDSQAAANAAMNCAHLKRVGETLLDLSYQPYSVRNSSHTNKDLLLKTNDSGLPLTVLCECFCVVEMENSMGSVQLSKSPRPDCWCSRNKYYVTIEPHPHVFCHTKVYHRKSNYWRIGRDK